MGEDPLSQIAAFNEPTVSTSRWVAADYARIGAFVPALGAAALDLLDPKPGERILDVGCGDGTLTRQIIERGADVVGIDSSPELAAVAREAGIDVRVGDAARMAFMSEFDAAFSNAALHWMVDPQRVANAIFLALKPGGRFAGEMGGEGNLERLREALDHELTIRGYAPPIGAANWYPSTKAFAAIYEAAGFEAVDARLIDRPTPLPHGIAAWVTTFRAGWLDRAGVPEAERSEIAAGVARALAVDHADYVRLRFIMRKPH